MSRDHRKTTPVFLRRDGMNDEKKERAEQIARIERNEALYDRIGRTVRRLERSIEAYEKMEPKIKELAAY